jgi:hypothetical protein
MGYTKKEQMHEALKNVLKVVQKSIGRDLSNGKNINLCLEAYNYWREEEREGINYIFNIDNADDLKYLVDKEILNACQIAGIYPKCTASGLFRIGEHDGDIEIITLDSLKDILCANMETLLRCVLMYVGEGNDTYNKVYNMLIANDLVQSDFSCLR